MDVLFIVLAVVGVIGLVALAYFFGFQKSDPTKAKIPDHMKSGVAWRSYEREQEKERSRGRGKGLAAALITFRFLGGDDD